MSEPAVFAVSITLHVKAISANQASIIANDVMMDGRLKHDSAYIHYIEDVITLHDPAMSWCNACHVTHAPNAHTHERGPDGHK